MCQNLLECETGERWWLRKAVVVCKCLCGSGGGTVGKPNRKYSVSSGMVGRPMVVGQPVVVGRPEMVGRPVPG